MRNIISIVVIVMLFSSCSTQVPPTPEVIRETPTPIVIVVTATLEPSSTPDLTVEGWETPPSEILLLFNPNTPHPQFPPASKFTETVAKRKFQFTNPSGFKFRDTSDGSLMENKEKTVMITLQLLVSTSRI